MENTGEQYRCDRVQQFSVLGVQETQVGLGEDRLAHIISEAASFLKNPSADPNTSKLFSSSAVKLTDSGVTTTIHGDLKNPVFSILKDEKPLLKMPVKSTRKASVVDIGGTHVIVVVEATGNSCIADGSTHLVLSLEMPSKKYAAYLLEILDVLVRSSSLDRPESGYLTMNCSEHTAEVKKLPQPQSGASAHEPSIYEPPTYEPPTYEPSTYEPRTYEPSTYEPSTYEPVSERSAAPVTDLYDPSIRAPNSNFTEETCKIIDGEKAFMFQLKQCIRKVRQGTEMHEIVERITKLHQSISFSLETESAQTLMKCLTENSNTIEEHVRFFDYVSIYGTRSPDLKVDIVSRLCSLRKWVDAQKDFSNAEKMEVLDVFSRTIRRISDRQVLLQIDQDKFNVLQCGEVMIQGNLTQMIKKKSSKVYAILTREILILTSNDYLYQTHVMTDKMSNASAYKESATEFEITLEAKVSEKKLHFKASDLDTMKKWLVNLNHIIRQSIDLYF